MSMVRTSIKKLKNIVVLKNACSPSLEPKWIKPVEQNKDDIFGLNTKHIESSWLTIVQPQKR